jgi:hemerythrin-like metal-binding protein
LEKIKWDEKFSIGISEIDAQHQKLFQMINVMNDIHNGEVLEKSSLGVVLLEMMEYLRSHFKTEEEMMEKTMYPDFTSHKKEHAIFIDTTIYFSEKMMKNKFITDELLLFLYNWLITHTMLSDQKFGAFAAEKTNGSEHL